jgi:hypothetical protein
MTRSPQPGELGPYQPVSDALVLAAIDRAQRHNPNGYDEGVLWSHLAEHLGFLHAPATTFKLRPQVARLRATGLIERRKARGYTLWRLTRNGRQQLTSAGDNHEDLSLPEAPQHRLWREAQTLAGERIDGLREQLRDTLSQASSLLGSERGGDSEAWLELSGRLLSQCDRLASATYCQREWPEPDDAHADIDSDTRRSFYWEASSEPPPATKPATRHRPTKSPG